MKKLIVLSMLAFAAVPLSACVCSFSEGCGSVQCEGWDPCAGTLGGHVYCSGTSTTTITGIQGCKKGANGVKSLPPVTCSATCVVNGACNVPITCSGSKTVYPQGPDSSKCNK